ncbi:hypothetical protein ZTR_07396 [Talaromyces verruculosus]|nr:hypothetical protein ZTR_07396 [Talaromyces verruculosus]
MSLLLKIPLELRELIIEHVLYTPVNPPAAPTESDLVQYNDLRYKAWAGGSAETYYTQQNMTSSSNCLPLLLTNHQISMETRAMLQRRKVDYILDISVKDDLILILTWLSVPSLTTHISTLYANVRLFGHIIEQHIICDQVGDGGRYGFHWSFYGALERFLRYGPVGGKRRKDEGKPSRDPWNIQEFENRGMLIDTLILDFQSAELDLAFPPEHVTYVNWLNRHCRSEKFDQSEIPGILSLYTTRPEWLCRYMEGWIRYLLQMSYITSAYGKPLYEQIGTIRMLVDGQLQCEFDLAAWLDGLRFTNPSDTMGHLPTDERVPGFWKWKRETMLRREAQGFPVKQPSNDEIGQREIEESVG